MEQRLALAATPVNPNAGSIIASQFQPYGYSLLGAQLLGVSAGRGQSIQLTAPNNSGTPPAPPPTYTYPDSTVNSGQITDSQVNVGGFTTLGMQLQNVTIPGGALRVDILDEGIGKPAAGGSQPVPVGGANSAPALVPPGSPGGPANSGIIASSQFNDGGFGDIGLQWSNVRVFGDVQAVHNSLSIQPEGSALAGVSVQNVTFGSAATSAGDRRLAPATLASLTVGPSGSAGPPPFVPNSAFARYPNRVNRTNQQFASGPAAATSLQWTNVTRDATGLVIVNNVLRVSNDGTAGTQAGAVAGSITLGGITFPGGVPPRALGSLSTARTSAPAAARRLLASGGSILQRARTNSATNSGTLSGNQFLDGGMGDIGLQWSDVTVNGSVRIEHNSCSINVVGDANGTGPINVSGIRFDSGWSASGAATDTLFLTPPSASPVCHVFYAAFVAGCPCLAL